MIEVKGYSDAKECRIIVGSEPDAFREDGDTKVPQFYFKIDQRYTIPQFLVGQIDHYLRLMGYVYRGLQHPVYQRTHNEVWELDLDKPSLPCLEMVCHESGKAEMVRWLRASVNA